MSDEHSELFAEMLLIQVGISLIFLVFRIIYGVPFDVAISRFLLAMLLGIPLAYIVSYFFSKPSL
jgi:hypothetical protein